MTPTAPHIRLRLGFFEDFPTVAGLLRDTGARPEGPRLFVIDGPMTVGQATALVRLLEYSRRDVNHPVTVETDPPVPTGSGSPYAAVSDELHVWWDVTVLRQGSAPNA
ncbi:hypothetical protein HY68_36490 [Streptomyces sp. AcH 505]|uniref:hypothetical protein n=1 Tax=Streptomyces sp. AcH 505 TaxID=352211 RepID=UPI000591ADBE|nr:hypothetical protein HY68_36490 [Streptomyces sp. AcH 505]